jgi:hypothetical protein
MPEHGDTESQYILMRETPEIIVGGISRGFLEENN